MYPLPSRTPVQPPTATFALEGVPTVVISLADSLPESVAIVPASADVPIDVIPGAIPDQYLRSDHFHSLPPDEHFSRHRFIVAFMNQHTLTNRLVVPAAAPITTFAEV